MAFPRPPTPLADRRLRDVLDLVAALVTVGLLALIYDGRSSLPRALLTLAFAGYAPGRAIVSNWPRLAGWSEAAMPVVFSLALLSLLATVTLWAHYWHPLGLFQAEAAASLAGLAVAVTRRHRFRLGSLALRPRRHPRTDA